MEGNIYRGELFFFIDSPLAKSEAFYQHHLDGGLFVMNGKVVETGPFEDIHARYPDIPVTDYSGKLILPGLIDTHLHYPQSEIIGMYGKQLLDWLDEYTFPAEESFSSAEYALSIARSFVTELLRNGTTSCAAYATVHPVSVDALFTVASEYGMCMLTGKVLMDRNAPEGLRDSSLEGEADSRALIEEWHGKGRNHYVITPRFAITSTPEQLERAGRLHQEYPTTYIQTHLSENQGEIESVRSLFPDSVDYLEVYEQAGLLTDRTIFGHCVHLTERAYKRLGESGAIIAHCPTSNLFLGSGLFDMRKANSYGLRTTLATDVGAGTSFSMWRTMGESYKVQQLLGYSQTAFEALYKCTLGAAYALSLADRIGSLMPGRDADFIVVDAAATPVQRLRRDYLRARGKWDIEHKLFGLQTLGDDRNTVATYLMGRKAYASDTRDHQETGVQHDRDHNPQPLGPHGR